MVQDEKKYIAPSTKPLRKPRPAVQHPPINHHDQKRQRRRTRIEQRMQAPKHAGQAIKNHRPPRRGIQQRMHGRHGEIEPHAPEIQEREVAERLPDCDGVVAGGVVDEDVDDAEKDVDGDYGAEEP